MPANRAPETRPRSATSPATLGYAVCDADHSNGWSYSYGRYFDSGRDARRNSCRNGRSSRGSNRTAQISRVGCNLTLARRPGPPRYSWLVAGIAGGSTAGRLRGRAGGGGASTDHPARAPQPMRERGADREPPASATNPGPAAGRGGGDAPSRRYREVHVHFTAPIGRIVRPGETARCGRRPSPVPVAHFPLPSRDLPTRHRAAAGIPFHRLFRARSETHQFQLRMATSCPSVVGGPGSRGRAGREVSIRPSAGCTVIICRARVASAAPPSARSSRAPPSSDTSVVTRLRSAGRGDEPRMNGQAVNEVRGCAAVTA